MKPSQAVLVVLLVAGMVVPAGPVAAQTAPEGVTFVESDIGEDTRWSSQGGPYRITQDVTVASGATLTLSAGTDVQLAEDVTLTVAGSLVADGTEARPVNVTMTPGAPAGVRWGTIRYAGDGDSELTLRNASVRGGTDAITVTANSRSVAVIDSTLGNHAGSALRVTETRRAPPITVRDSTVRDVGGHALEVTPGFGALGRVHLTPRSDAASDSTTHRLSVAPGTPTTTDEIRIDYDDHGDLSNAGFRDLVVHTDSDGVPERRLNAMVSRVEGEGDSLTLHLERDVNVGGDSRVVVEYDGVRNPDTRGIYPVSVGFDRDNVSQLPSGVVAPLNVGGVTDAYVDVRPDGATEVPSLTVRDSTFEGVNGSAVFVAADRVAATWVSANRIASTAGAGVAFHARELDASLRANDISVGDAGVAVSHRNSITLDAFDNRVTDSEAGIRIRQSGPRSAGDVRPTLGRNEFAGNERYGVEIWSETATLKRFGVNENDLADNGWGGVVLESPRVTNGTVSENRVLGNGGDGVRVEAQSLRGVTAADNTVRDNGGAGIDVSTRLSARRLAVTDNRVRDGGGHAVSVRTGLVAHRTHVGENRLSNNAGAGVLVSSPVTHGGALNVTNNTVAANAYGVVVEGALRATLADNEVVFNTNEEGETDALPAEPGTGVWLGEGAAGAVLERGNATESLDDLVADPDVDAQLSRTALDGNTVVVLRTDRRSEVHNGYPGALSVREVSEGIPTGIALSADGPESPGPTLVRNDVYGGTDALVVDIDTLVNASTSARIVIDQMRTVHAEQNYWGAASGPRHTSILPGGEGGPVVTEHGWVDFVPFAAERFGEPYERPDPRLDAPASALPGRTVTVSGANSSAAASYEFSVDAADVQRDGSRLSFTMPNRSVTVELAVEGRLGIDSAAPATATVERASPNASASAPANETTNGTATNETTNGTATGTAVSAGGAEASFLRSLIAAGPSPAGGNTPLVGGVLGAIPSLAGFGLGVYGVTLSRRNRKPPVSVFTVQGLVISGVLVWMVAGLLTDPFLLRIGVGAALVWMALTAAAYVALRFR
jgi:hypothetical protein